MEDEKKEEVQNEDKKGKEEVGGALEKGRRRNRMR